MSRQLGDNVYDENNFANSFLQKYEMANQKNKADFYGQQAQDYGKSAEAHEKMAEAEGPAEPSAEDGAAGFAKGFSQGSNPQDAIGNGLMMSGNPYAMAAGGVMKVASMGQQRQQAQREQARAAYIDRQNRLREIGDKIMSTNFGV